MKVDISNVTNERARIYLKQKSDNDFVSYEYIAWINRNIRKFKEQDGINQDFALNDEQHERFTEYLREALM